VAILTYNRVEEFLIITTVEIKSIDEQLKCMLTGTLKEIATLLERKTTPFVISSCFYFCPFVLPYSFKSGESLFNN
jgi:hypothetical protein